MTTPSFPAYAKILYSGFGETRAAVVMRTEMESGPPKQARIRSKPMIKRPVQILLSSAADYQSFKNWYSADIAEGALWFSMTDPVTGSTINARFVAADLAAMPDNNGLTRWIVKANIESWG